MNHLILLFLLLPFTSFAQTFYSTGSSETVYEKAPEKNLKTDIFMITYADPTGPSFEIVRCAKTGDECVSYRMALSRGTDFKWTLESPNPDHSMVKSPAKVEGDPMKVNSFTSSKKMPDGTTYAMNARFLEKSSIWKTTSTASWGGKISEVTTKLNSVEKSVYDSGLKGKKIKKL